MSLHNELMDEIRDFNDIPFEKQDSETDNFLYCLREDIDEFRTKNNLSYEINEEDFHKTDDNDTDEEVNWGDKDNDYYTVNSGFGEEEDPREQKIYDFITNSAKRRFNYKKKKKQLSNMAGDKAPENLLWEVICNLHANQHPEEIQSNIFMQLAMLGVMMEQKDILDFIVVRHKDCALEIIAVQVATDNLNNGFPPDAVLQQTRDFLS